MSRRLFTSECVTEGHPDKIADRIGDTVLDDGPFRSSLTWEDGAVLAVDQRALPQEHRVLRLETVDQLIDAIRSLAVRGAPAIGLAGALGVALSAHRHRTGADGAVDETAVRADSARIASARPTAVHLARAVERALARLAEGPEAVLREAVAMQAEDAAVNRAAVRRAADLVVALTPDRPLRILTHCNTGRLATAAVGTALGTILELAARGRVSDVLVDETRPLLQGSRLTAWELGEAGVPYRVCVDSAAAAAMSRGLVDCVLVGADRIAANGDTANKIGTYGLAVAAARHGIPFVVVAPESTWDRELPDGSGIRIEEREAAEVTAVAGAPVAPAGAAVFNPAFDVTPAELITAVVSDRQVFRPAATPATPATPATAGGPRPVGELGELGERVTELLTSFADHPKPGIVFRDLAGVYAEPGLVGRIADGIAEAFAGRFDSVLAIESRGFVLGAALAARTGAPLVLARKPGKLPGPVHRASYSLEYGEDLLELQKGAVRPGERVLCVDDVLATGGTLAAATALVTDAGAEVAGLAAVVELLGLGGAQRLSAHRLLTLSRVPA